MVERTIWPLSPHTAAKHVILKRHLDAWLPIMTQFNDQLLFIDGFAGPGRYEGGEQGSPLVALRAAVLNRRFRERPPRCKIHFLFIEEDSERVSSLREELDRFTSENPFPQWVTYQAEQAEFAAYMRRELDRLTFQSRRAPAIFAFIDPFGYSGLPMTLITRIQNVPSSECLINFASRSITRWVGEDEVRIDLVDELFGSSDWQLHRNDEHALVNFYGDQLRARAGFRHIRTFQMKGQQDVTEYFLAFATNSDKGLSVFKSAAWKADPHGGRMFSDASDPNQLFLVSPLPPLQGLLQERFGGRGWVSIEDVEEWVLLHTDYSEKSHLKLRTLKELENAGVHILRVQRPMGKRRRPGEYPEGTLLLFGSAR